MADKPRKAQLMNRDGTFGRPKPKPKPKPKRKKGGQQLMDKAREGSLKKRANKALDKLKFQHRMNQQYKEWKRMQPYKKGDPVIASFGSVSNGPRPGGSNPRI